MPRRTEIDERTKVALLMAANVIEAGTFLGDDKEAAGQARSIRTFCGNSHVGEIPGPLTQWIVAPSNAETVYVDIPSSRIVKARDVIRQAAGQMEHEIGKRVIDSPGWSHLFFGLQSGKLLDPRSGCEKHRVSIGHAQLPKSTNERTKFLGKRTY